MTLELSGQHRSGHPAASEARTEPVASTQQPETPSCAWRSLATACCLLATSRLLPEQLPAARTAGSRRCGTRRAPRACRSAPAPRTT
ncbi:MAG: hypothetical protein MZV64_28155 [Ignavibacteriales bacterium]|nr:hypothetical protein [Ignavibacteriales bacterium]